MEAGCNFYIGVLCVVGLATRLMLPGNLLCNHSFCFLGLISAKNLSSKNSILDYPVLDVPFFKTACIVLLVYQRKQMYLTWTLFKPRVIKSSMLKAKCSYVLHITSIDLKILSYMLSRAMYLRLANVIFIVPSWFCTAWYIHKTCTCSHIYSSNYFLPN